MFVASYESDPTSYTPPHQLPIVLLQTRHNHYSVSYSYQLSSVDNAVVRSATLLLHHHTANTFPYATNHSLARTRMMVTIVRVVAHLH